MSALSSAKPSRALYWPVQARRNIGVRSLFVVVLAFLIAYGVLFPRLLTAAGFAKFTQSWFPLALVARGQAVLIL
ncbi:ABC transporter permease, partial [Mesorhizobium sp. M1D.F.Ca.ET.183.01.1.1]